MTHHENISEQGRQGSAPENYYCIEIATTSFSNYINAAHVPYAVPGCTGIWVTPTTKGAGYKQLNTGPANLLSVQSEAR
jgi:hypothetical protein